MGRAVRIRTILTCYIENAAFQSKQATTVYFVHQLIQQGATD
jgi:hypothetical protein